MASRAGVAWAASLCLLSTAVRAETWHRAYERGQQLLLQGEAASAEAAFRAALEDNPRSGCRLRTYGVRVRDYVPWYYLGVAIAEQGREEEAAVHLERSLAEGVLEDCPGTQLQLLDLLDRLDRMRGRSEGAEGASAPTEIGPLREEALSAGAASLAPELVERARALERDCGPSCEDAARAWLAALSRTRVERPLLILLERSARMSLAAAELALRGAREPSAAAASLAAARTRLEGAASAGDWLAVEQEAERALSLIRPVTPEPVPTRPRGVDLRPSLGAAIERALRAREKALGSEAEGPSPEGLAGADLDLAAARSLLDANERAAWERGLSLAERARSAFARFAAVSRKAAGPDAAPALLELPRSAGSRVPGPALIPAGAGG